MSTPAWVTPELLGEFVVCAKFYASHRGWTRPMRSVMDDVVEELDREVLMLAVARGQIPER